MKIAILGAKELITVQLLNLLNKNNYNQISCFDELKSSISFGKEILQVKKIEMFNCDDYDYVFVMNSDYYVDSLSNSKCTVIGNDLDGNVFDPIVTAVSKILENYEEVSNLNINASQSIARSGKKVMDAFFKELKLFQIKNMHEGLYYDSPMAFNIASVGKINEEGISDQEEKIQQQLKKKLAKDSLVTLMRVPVLKVEVITLSFELIKEISIKQIIKQIEKSGIYYVKNSFSALEIENEDALFVFNIKKQGNSVSLVLAYDSLRQFAINMFKMLK